MKNNFKNLYAHRKPAKRKSLILLTAIAMSLAMTAMLCSCGSSDKNAIEKTSDEKRTEIEETLNLANNNDQAWTYAEKSDSWTLSPVSAVAYPEIEDEQGASVCVPGAYVKGIDTDGDGKADVSASDAAASGSEVKGSLVIDNDAEVTSENGQVYTAASAPVIFNTGAAGYASQKNSNASSEYASCGYINVTCGNRGKQDTLTDEDGNTTYTGDAPSCLADQKAAVRYIKYNILLGNLPGNTDCFVSTGGSGGGAHAAMLAATSNNSDYYAYEIEAGAVGVYSEGNGKYSCSVTIDDEDYDLSDGVWGCMAYSAITSLSEADMALAFEYYLDSDYDFSSDFQAKLAEYLSDEYMDYINDQNLSVKESEVGFDLNNDGDKKDTIDLTIQYDKDGHEDTKGYYGTYLDLYLAEFTSNLQWYLDNLDYADGWTWFDEDGNALSDSEVSEMSSEDKAKAFIEGRYAKSSSDEDEEGIGDLGTPPDLEGDGDLPSDDAPNGTPPDMNASGENSSEIDGDDEAGTPDGGTTQSASGSTDSANYSSYKDLLEAYQSDISEIENGDEYSNNIVSLYDPLQYIGAEGTENPTWTRIVMGASEGDMSMFSSLNLQLAWLSAGTDATIEWQWDGEHVPSEIFGNSLSLYVDQMYGKYVKGAETIEKEEAEAQTKNGSADEASGTDISSMVDYSDLSDISLSLADAVSYRTKGASKAMPGFDVIDYGQEDYVFGSSDKDARHWDKYVLQALEDHEDTLESLFNK